MPTEYVAISIESDEDTEASRRAKLSDMGCGRIEWECPRKPGAKLVIKRDQYPIENLPCPCGAANCWVLKWTSKPKPAPVNDDA